MARTIGALKLGNLGPVLAGGYLYESGDDSFKFDVTDVLGGELPMRYDRRRADEGTQWCGFNNDQCPVILE